jgi:hypothetical protein
LLHIDPLGIGQGKRAFGLNGGEIAALSKRRELLLCFH